MLELESPSEADTRAIGRRLAALCRPGDVIVLNGKLGTGKTALAGGIGDGLGVDEQVTSPTFVLMRSYRSGFLPLIHVDAYRLGSIGEFDDLAAVEDGQDGVVVVEWGEAVAVALPKDRLEVELTKTGETSRMLRFHAKGTWLSRPLAEVEGA